MSGSGQNVTVVPVCFASVSYTHLDVYKRQTYVCTRELTHLESHPCLSLANRVSIGERYGYMSMVV